MEGGAGMDASPFPVDPTLDEMHEAIADRKDIHEFTFEHFVLFAYTLITSDTFPDPSTAPDARTRRMWQLRRECRGIVFSRPRDGQPGRLLGRRMHKFFNVSEQRETRPENVDWSQPHSILTKLDGSMISPFMLMGDVYWATKKGPSPVATQVATFVQAGDNQGIDYDGFVRHVEARGFTSTFEWCSRSNPIILDYPSDTLTLLALRHRSTGMYMAVQEMQACADEWRVPVASQYADDVVNSVTGLQQLVDLVRQHKGLEGCVVRFDNGLWIKVKTQWYHSLNKGLHTLTKTKHNNERYIWQVVLNQEYDDMKAFIGEVERQRLDRFADDLSRAANATAADMAHGVTAWLQHDVAQEGSDASTKQRRFAAWAREQPMGRHHAALYFKLLKLGEDRESKAPALIIDYLLARTRKRLDDTTRELVQGLRFADYELQRDADSNVKSFSDWH